MAANNGTPKKKMKPNPTPTPKPTLSSVDHAFKLFRISEGSQPQKDRPLHTIVPVEICLNPLYTRLVELYEFHARFYVTRLRGQGSIAGIPNPNANQVAQICAAVVMQSIRVNLERVCKTHFPEYYDMMNPQFVNRIDFIRDTGFDPFAIELIHSILPVKITHGKQLFIYVPIFSHNVPNWTGMGRQFHAFLVGAGPAAAHDVDIAVFRAITLHMKREARIRVDQINPSVHYGQPWVLFDQLSSHGIVPCPANTILDIYSWFGQDGNYTDKHRMMSYIIGRAVTDRCGEYIVSPWVVTNPRPAVNNMTTDQIIDAVISNEANTTIRTMMTCWMAHVWRFTHRIRPNRDVQVDNANLPAAGQVYIVQDGPDVVGGPTLQVSAFPFYEQVVVNGSASLANQMFGRFMFKP